MTNSSKEAYDAAALKAAQEIDPKIPSTAKVFFYSINAEVLRDFELEGGVMDSSEVEDLIESNRADVKLPKGFMMLGFRDAGPESGQKSKEWFVVVDTSGLPKIAIDDAPKEAAAS